MSISSTAVTTDNFLIQDVGDARVVGNKFSDKWISSQSACADGAIVSGWAIEASRIMVLWYRLELLANRHPYLSLATSWLKSVIGTRWIHHTHLATRVMELLLILGLNWVFFVLISLRVKHWTLSQWRPFGKIFALSLQNVTGTDVGSLEVDHTSSHIAHSCQFWYSN